MRRNINDFVYKKKMGCEYASTYADFGLLPSRIGFGNARAGVAADVEGFVAGAVGAAAEDFDGALWLPSIPCTVRLYLLPVCVEAGVAVVVGVVVVLEVDVMMVSGEALAAALGLPSICSAVRLLPASGVAAAVSVDFSDD